MSHLEQATATAETDRWLDDYGASHRDIRNPGIYWLAVPLLVTATVGMLWSLPAPEEFRQISPLLNWGSVFLMAAVVYYFIISVSLAIGMLPFVFGICGLQLWLSHSEFGLVPVSAALFVGSIAGLFAGQIKNGGIRAVFQDIQMMMIGPVWILSRLYRRAGIPF
jgi:uncharacterized membrane protein YGL010W